MELSTTLFWRHNFRPAISYLALAMLLILIFFRNRKIAFAITALSFLVVNVGLTALFHPRAVGILVTLGSIMCMYVLVIWGAVLLSLHGAGLLSPHKLSPEQEMVLRWPERNKEAEIRVVGQIGEDSGVYTYSVAFFDHVENFWEMEFPPPTPKEQELGVLTKVCYMCQTFERVDDHSIEADVVATNDGVLRYCKCCGNSTIWKVGQPGAVPAAAANASAPPPTSPHLSMPAPMTPPQRVASPPAFASGFNPADPPPFPVAAQPENAGASAYSEATPSDLVVGLPALRRGLPLLLKVNYIALVRHAERGEEFVQCEDVSRGGLRFKSTSRYMEQTLIEVAAPYSSGQAAIFVAARIVFAQELPEQNLFRYGVQYLHTDRPRGAF